MSFFPQRSAKLHSPCGTHGVQNHSNHRVGGRTALATVDHSTIRGSEPHERLSSRAYLGLRSGVGITGPEGSRGLP